MRMWHDTLVFFFKKDGCPRGRKTDAQTVKSPWDSNLQYNKLKVLTMTRSSDHSCMLAQTELSAESCIWEILWPYHYSSDNGNKRIAVGKQAVRRLRAAVPLSPFEERPFTSCQVPLLHLLVDVMLNDFSILVLSHCESRLKAQLSNIHKCLFVIWSSKPLVHKQGSANPEGSDIIGLEALGIKEAVVA